MSFLVTQNSSNRQFRNFSLIKIPALKRFFFQTHPASFTHLKIMKIIATTVYYVMLCFTELILYCLCTVIEILHIYPKTTENISFGQIFLGKIILFIFYFTSIDLLESPVSAPSRVCFRFSFLKI